MAQGDSETDLQAAALAEARAEVTRRLDMLRAAYRDGAEIRYATARLDEAVEAYKELAIRMAVP